MPLSKEKVLDRVEIHTQHQIIGVKWLNKILEDGQEISSTLERTTYGQERQAEFITDIGGIEIAQPYIDAVGWEA